MDPKVKAATLSVVSNSSLVAMKLAVGLATGSISILSEAAHSALDLFAAIIAFLSVRASGRPADKEHPFGHGKIENLSGAIEAVLILFAAILIIHESADRLRHPGRIETIGAGILVMGISAIANALISRYLFKVAHRTDSIALEADAQHLSADVWTSVGVFAGLGFIQITGWHVLDPVVAILVALMIMRVAFTLTWKAAGPLLDVRLPDEEVKELENIVMRTPGIVGFHKLRTRKAGSCREIDYHLIVPADMPVVSAHAMAEDIEDKMRDRFPRTTVVTHIEPDTDDTISEPDTAMKDNQLEDGPPPPSI